jgi:chromosome segregation ATPase
MMAPLPSSSQPADRPESPRVRLDVRLASGRTVNYEVGADEFLIGGASGCDFRIPAPNLPPVICQLIRKPEGLWVRRLTPLLTVLLNETPLSASNLARVNSGDKLALGGVEIVVSIQAAPLLIPKFVALDPDIAEEATTAARAPSREDEDDLEKRRRLLEIEEEARREQWKRQDEELAQRALELERQTEDLEADRVIWYRRRDEIEQELERRIKATEKTDARVSGLDDRERELMRVKEELSSLRERLLKEYQDRRDELARFQDDVRGANARLQGEREAFAAEEERRRAELEADVEKHHRLLEEETARRREQLDDELKQRRVAFESELAALKSQAEAETLARTREQAEQLERLRTAAQENVSRAQAEAAKITRDAETEAARLRETFQDERTLLDVKKRELLERQERLTAALQDLTRQRDLFSADRELLEKARQTFEANRSAEAERLSTQEQTLTQRSAELARREEQLRGDRQSLDRDRAQLQEDLVRLARRTAAVEEQERVSAERMRDADIRLEQLKRDAAEWEETIRLATVEQERLRAEAERLDRQRAELDAQSATLAERAGQLEAQQAVLAVLRAKLDRTRQDAEREAVQLAIARSREDEAFAELRQRIQDAEELRAELATVQETAAQERQRLEERDSLLTASLEELRKQKEALAAEGARLQQREAELDARAAEFAEQAGTLKGRMTQALDLQTRLEADRVALRERESALAQAEEARQTLQEQLRRRAEDLAARARALDEAARKVAAERATLDQARTQIDNERSSSAGELADHQRRLEERAAEVSRLAAAVAEKEETLARQADKLKEAGAAVAAERTSLLQAREQWEADRQTAVEADRKSREELAAFRAQAAAEIEALRQQAPELEGQAAAALDRLAGARETLRGHLKELNDFARLSRDDLTNFHAQVRQEAERLREQEDALNRVKGEHRLSVTAFRQQLIEWQGQVAQMKRLLTSSESRLDARQAAVDQAAKQVDANTVQLAEQAEQLRKEREAVSARRSEVERHLADMREWYRTKLRELASGRAEIAGEPPHEKPRLARLDDGDASPGVATAGANASPAALEELDPGDRQLGELLRSHGLVDGDTLNALWSEAGRQRRTLRQVLLASGAITLYQLALIEAGNLDALMLGRFRVIDRLRATPREVIYRVFDPADRERADRSRSIGAHSGISRLRHLAEAEMHDAVHPDEFRQRFAAARDAAHANLAAVLEVLEINGRPAVVQEWLTGLFSADWPAQAAHPGCWVRLAAMAAAGIDAAHRHGLVHGRLTSDSFVLTGTGTLKVTGFGEPPWLSPGPAPQETTPAADLRAFGQVLFGWSHLASKRKGAAKPKPFPDALQAVIRRLEADPEPPMADTVAAERPYESAAELITDLDRIARETAFSDDAWEKLLKHVADNAPDAPAGLKRSA